jgi:hypothetical protein
MYPLPIGLALVDLLVEHTQRRVERADRAAREAGRVDEPARRPLPHRRAHLLRRRAVA